MPKQASSDPIRQQALAGLMAHLISEGKDPEYAKWMATSIIFQTDLDLISAQMANLLNWLKQEHEDIYPSCLAVVEKTREDFEQRVQTG